MEIELDPNFRPVGQLPAEPEGIEGDPLDPLEQLSAEWDRRAMPKQKLSVQEEGEDDDEA